MTRYVVVGAGIVGLATAHRLTLEHPGAVGQVPSSDILYARMINDTVTERPSNRFRKRVEERLPEVIPTSRTSPFTPSRKFVPRILHVSKVLHR